MANSVVAYLSENKFIEKFNTGFSEQYRLSKPFSFYVSEENIKTLKDAYTPDEEKGGVIISNPSSTNGCLNFIKAEIVFVTNKSPNKHREYEPDTKELNAALLKANSKNALPFMFHTHPTEAPNFILETMNYHFQMDTSPQDKMASLYYTFDEIPLRLPEILVTVNGKMKTGLFFGFYGGLVAPLDFRESKDKAMKNLAGSLENVNLKLDTLPKKLIAGGLGILTLWGLIKNPKMTGGILGGLVLGSALAIPNVAYSAQGGMEFFGVSTGLPLAITFPEIADEKIRSAEIEIQRLIQEKMD